MFMTASRDFGHLGRFEEAFEFVSAGRVAEFAEGFWPRSGGCARA